MRAKLQVVKEELRRRMHETIDAQGAWLRRVVMGFYAYHAVPTNAVALADFRFNITNLWRRTLCWRGQKGKVGDMEAHDRAAGSMASQAADHTSLA
jgi:RNA-directed DNA polymerase